MIIRLGRLVSSSVKEKLFQPMHFFEPVIQRMSVSIMISASTLEYMKSSHIKFKGRSRVFD